MKRRLQEYKYASARLGFSVSLFVLFSMSLFAVHTAHAFKSDFDLVADGTLKGIITDSTTNETLVGVSVSAQGTRFGSSSDVNGNYSMSMPEGTYEISISYIGYETAIISNVKIVAGQTTTLNYSLTPASTELEAFEIIGDKALSGKVIETNNLSLVNSIKSSLLITTGISAQQISRSADQDAGEVAKRLPGVAIINNFVNIRGMNERYNITVINGMLAPSSEADRRAFSFDLLPSNMIDKMTIYRSPAPELLADWAGGVIKIDTKNSSVAREIEVNLSTSYRTNSTFKDYDMYNGGKKDWLGKDDGTRALPAGFPEVGAIPAGGLTESSQQTTRNLANYTPEAIAANAALGKTIYKDYNLKKENAGLDFRAGINYYDSRKFGKMRLSNLTSISTTQSTLIRYQEFNPLISVRIVGGQSIFSSGSTTNKDTINQQVSRWSLLQNLALTINPRHSINLNGIFNRLGIDEVSLRDAYNTSTFAPSAYSTRIIYTYRSRSILGLQASGKHAFGSEEYPHTVAWTAGYNSSSEEIPAQRTLFFTAIKGANVDEEKLKRILYSNTNTFTIDNSLFYSETKETNLIYSLDYEKKLKFGPTLKAGFFNENKVKPITSRLIRTGAVVDTTVTRINPEDGFKEEKYKDDGTGYFLSDDNTVSGQYDVTGKIYAGYMAVNLPFFQDKLKVYGGVRYEGQDLLLVTPPNAALTAQGKDPEIINRYIDYWLPSVNLTYNFTNKIALRAAYGKTINRPNFRELIPLTVYDPRLENKTSGTDSLKDARIDNYDIRLEYFPGEGDFIALGGYYKKLTDAIEPYVLLLGNDEDVFFANTKSIVVMGVELEVRKSFNFLPWAWGRNLSTIGNFALLKSEVQLDNQLNGTPGDFRDSRSSNRPMEGTPNFVANVGLYYDHIQWGSKVSLIYNIIGQRLISAGTAAFPDTYELSRHALDITFRQRITKFLELRASAQDVLNQPRRMYRDYDKDQQFIPDKRNKLGRNDWLYQSFRPGTYFTLGINLKL